MDQQQLIQLFADAARAHTAVHWFDSGSRDFTFTNMANIEYPMVFLQSTGASAADNRITYNFTVYSLVQPLPEPQVNEMNFEWDTAIAESRDTALQILKDVVGRVRLNNRQNFTLAHTAWVSDGDRLVSDNNANAVGWRTDITINMDFIQDDSNFPA